MPSARSALSQCSVLDRAPRVAFSSVALQLDFVIIIINDLSLPLISPAFLLVSPARDKVLSVINDKVAVTLLCPSIECFAVNLAEKSESARIRSSPKNMATTMRRKNSTSIDDYPEHLNPFHDDDNHNRIRFWTISRKKGRSNSFSVSSFNLGRNTWSLKSFMKKDKKQNLSDTAAVPQFNGSAPSSPIVYRKPLSGSQTTTGLSTRTTVQAVPLDRYVYGGSITPLPRSRFQERVKSTQPETNGFRTSTPERTSFSHRSGVPYALPGLTKNDVTTSSRVSVESSNPFDDQSPIPAVRRKKKKAPLPPATPNGSILSTSLLVTDDSMNESGVQELKPNSDVNIDDPSLQIELQIIEDSAPAPETKKKIDQEISVEPLVVRIDHCTATEDDSPEANNINPEKEGVIKSTHDDKELSDVDKELQDTIEMLSSISSDDTNNNRVLFEKVNVTSLKQPDTTSTDAEEKTEAKIAVSDDGTKVNNKNSVGIDLEENIDESINFNSSLFIDEGKLNGTTKIEHRGEYKDGPEKVVCKIYDNPTPRRPSTDVSIYDNASPRRPSTDVSISSIDKEFVAITSTAKQSEIEIRKLKVDKGTLDNVKPEALPEAQSTDNIPPVKRSNTFTKLRQIFDSKTTKSNQESKQFNIPNPIPKPRRSRLDSPSPTATEMPEI